MANNSKYAITWVNIIRAVWPKIEDAKRVRRRDEIATDYDILSGRLDILRDDCTEGETLASIRVYSQNS